MTGYVNMYGARQVGPAVIPESRKGYNAPTNDNVPVAPQPARGTGDETCWQSPGPSAYLRGPHDPAYRHGPFIQVWPNRKFYPFDPREEDVHIDSIANGLAHICRYSGAVDRHYSVAEHSVLTARWLRNKCGVTSALCALLHDAPEALSGFGDVGRPVKGTVPLIGQTEEYIWRLAVSARYQLPKELPPEVHEADSRIIADEVAANLAPMEWHAKYNNPLGVNIRCWYPWQAKEEFLATFEALMDCRARGME